MQILQKKILSNYFIFSFEFMGRILIIVSTAEFGNSMCIYTQMYLHVAFSCCYCLVHHFHVFLLLFALFVLFSSDLLLLFFRRHFGVISPVVCRYLFVRLWGSAYYFHLFHFALAFVTQHCFCFPCFCLFSSPHGLFVCCTFSAGFSNCFYITFGIFFSFSSALFVSPFAFGFRWKTTVEDGRSPLVDNDCKRKQRDLKS